MTENAGLCEKARQASPEAPGAAMAPAPAPLPSDDELVGFLEAYPRRSLAQICDRFGVILYYSPTRPRSDGATDGYTEEAKALRNQLQRLRRARKIRCESTRWEAR